MRNIIITLLLILVPVNYATAATVSRISFSVDANNYKTYKSALSKIESSAKKAAKSKCPAKTKFFATAISINVGVGSNEKYTANANYTGECRNNK